MKPFQEKEEQESSAKRAYAYAEDDSDSDSDSEEFVDDDGCSTASSSSVSSSSDDDDDDDDDDDEEDEMEPDTAPLSFSRAELRAGTMLAPEIVPSNRCTTTSEVVTQHASAATTNTNTGTTNSNDTKHTNPSVMEELRQRRQLENRISTSTQEVTGLPPQTSNASASNAVNASASAVSARATGFMPTAATARRISQISNSQSGISIGGTLPTSFIDPSAATARLISQISNSQSGISMGGALPTSFVDPSRTAVSTQFVPNQMDAANHLDAASIHPMLSMMMGLSSQPNIMIPPQDDTNQLQRRGFSIPLSVEGQDEEHLNKYQCLLRKQIELFEAGPNETIVSPLGFPRPLFSRQVGLRCRHCADNLQKNYGAIFYCNSFLEVRLYAQDIADVHMLRDCPKFLPALKMELMLYKNQAGPTSPEQVVYWCAALRFLGVQERGGVLCFHPNISNRTVSSLRNSLPNHGAPPAPAAILANNANPEQQLQSQFVVSEEEQQSIRKTIGLDTIFYKEKKNNHKGYKRATGDNSIIDNNPQSRKERRKCIAEYQHDNWKVKYKHLKAFKEQNGHCCVPYGYSEDASLGQWVKRQRHQMKRRQANEINNLTEERIQMLKDIGFTWDSHNDSWELKYQDLLCFYRKFGHSRVPLKYDGGKLTNWLKKQRKHFKKLILNEGDSTMNDQRYRKLSKLGVTFKQLTLVQTSPKGTNENT